MQSDYRLDHDVILNSVDNILNVSLENDPGLPNPEAKRLIVEHGERIRASTDVVYINDKAGDIIRYADMIYSKGSTDEWSGIMGACDQIIIDINTRKEKETEKLSEWIIP